MIPTNLVPEKYDFGSGELVELSYLQSVFGISRRTAAKYLSVLHIKPMYIGNRIFFSLPTFKRILYVLTRPGSLGFLFPGSNGKNNPRLLKDVNYISEVTQEILAQASEPRILAEMNAAEGRDPNILRKLLTNPVGRPKEKKEE
jgi:hypothetical protein